MSSTYYGIMKFEVKTQNDNLSNFSLSFFLVFALISFLILLSNLSIKLGTRPEQDELAKAYDYFSNLQYEVNYVDRPYQGKSLHVSDKLLGDINIEKISPIIKLFTFKY